jgi:hypothetical protein
MYGKGRNLKVALVFTSHRTTHFPPNNHHTQLLMVDCVIAHIALTTSIHQEKMRKGESG